MNSKTDPNMLSGYQAPIIIYISSGILSICFANLSGIPPKNRSHGDECIFVDVAKKIDIDRSDKTCNRLLTPTRPYGPYSTGMPKHANTIFLVAAHRFHSSTLSTLSTLHTLGTSRDFHLAGGEKGSKHPVVGHT